MDKSTVFPLIGFVLGFAGLGVAYLAIFMGIRHERFKREVEHTERMRALELGRSLPGDVPWLSTQRIGFLMAAVVPPCVFGFAWLSTQTAGFHDVIWNAAGLVSTLAPICGSVLVCIDVSRRIGDQAPLRPSDKIPVEDDAYDVVSARG